MARPSRWMTLAWMAVAAAATFAFYVREQALFVFAVLLQEIIYETVYLLPAVLCGRLLVRRLAPGQVNSAFGVVTAGALGLGAIGFATFALSLAGLLGETSAWMVLGGAAGVGLIDAKDLAESLSGAKQRLAQWLKAASEGGWIWVPAALLLAIPLIGSTLLPGTLWRPDDPHPYDSLVYHLQIPREWYELGSMRPLLHNVYSFFPFNVEMHYLLANYLRGGPYIAMQQNQLFSLACTILAASGVWGWLKLRGAGPGAAVAAVTILTLPWILMLACVTYVESTMILWGALGICWILSAISGTDRPMGAFAMAGAMAGLASGAKLTGVPMLLVGLPAAAVVAMAVGRFRALPPKRFVMGVLVFGVVGAAVLSPWLIRNQIWAGNPLFPLAMKQLGQAHFSDTQVERFDIAHQAAAGHRAWSARFTRLGTQVLVNWRFNYAVFPLAVVAAVLARRRPEAVALLALILITGIFWLTVTHLMGRFFVLAIVPAALLIGMLPRKWLLPSGAAIGLIAVNSWIGPTLAFDQLEGTRNLHQLFEHYAAQGRLGLFGLQDYTVLDPPDLHEKTQYAKEVVLVGDTQVFYRQMPMSKIRYCTVFDLSMEGDRDIFDAYYAPPPAKCPWDVLVLIDESETRRLSRTYFGVPEVPEPAPDRFKEVMTVRVESVR